MRFLLILILFMAWGCAYGPKDPKQSSLDVLNGDNYGDRVIVLGAPIAERKTRHSTIRGKIVLIDGITPLIVNGAQVNLSNDGKIVVSSARSLSDGSFEFVGDLPTPIFRGETLLLAST